MDVLNHSPGCPLEVRLGSPLDVILGCSQDVGSGCPRNGQIGSLGDILGTLRGTSSGRPGDQYLPAGYNIKIDGKNFLDRPMNDDTKTYENI